MVSLTLITTLFVGVLLSFQSAPVNGQGWDINWELTAPKPKPKPKCPFNLFGGIGEFIHNVGTDIGNGLAAIGQGAGDLAHGLGKGVGCLAEGVGKGVGDLAVGLGKGVGDLAIGVGTGVGTAAVGIGQGLGTAVGGVGAGLGAILGGLGTCLLNVGLGIGVGLHNLFHGCDWHLGGHNRGVISIGLPGHTDLANNIENGPHITYTSSVANGKGLITFHFTLAQGGKIVAKFSKDYPLRSGSGSEVRNLMQTFISYCKSQNHHYQAKAPAVSGNIKWYTKTSNGRTVITLKYQQYSGDTQQPTMTKTKNYVLHSGSQEEVKDAIAKFKNDLQSGNI